MTMLYQAQARYVHQDRRVYDDSHCLYCGSFYGICRGEPRACRVTTCLACGTPQCMVNSLARGQCAICYVGLLPGWSGSDCQCSYKGCGQPAVARCDGVNKNRCPVHLERGKWAGHVARRLAERDKYFVLKPAITVPRLGQSG